MSPRSAVLAAGAALALLASGCGKTVIDQKKAEKYVREGLVSQGVQPSQIKSVSCPKDVGVKKGKTFDCTASDTSGEVIRITLRMLDGKGTVKPAALKRIK